ncbi:MAG: FtsW/RodA/SpoVE family cell cycle protein, partial [Puniceicoccales bacterium]
LCVLALTSIGLTVLLSAGGTSDSLLGSYFARQIVWFGLAFVAGLVAFTFGVGRIQYLVWPMVIFTVLMMILVLFPGIGVEVNGARRWISLGPLRFQPSEFGKIGFLGLLAWYVYRNGRQMDRLVPGFLIPAALVAPFTVLLILEPDLGTTVLYIAVAGAILLAAGTPFRALLAAGLIVALAITILILHSPERLQRVTSFLDLEGNRSEGGYQLWQGILGFSVGGLEGAGPGRGRQHLSFLPEAHTDFIFAVVGEELGFVATGGVVLLFTGFTVLALSQIRKAPDLFEFTVVFGALLFVIGQAMINMGVVTGLLPTKGMSLPFLSYGGSNLVVVCTLTGIILSAFREWEAPVIQRPVEIE